MDIARQLLIYYGPPSSSSTTASALPAGGQTRCARAIHGGTRTRRTGFIVDYDFEELERELDGENQAEAVATEVQEVTENQAYLNQITSFILPYFLRS